MQDNPKRLYRSRRDRMVGGVCAGLAEYLGIDPALVRVLWVFFTFFGGFGLFLYIVAYFIVPVNPEHTISPEAQHTSHYGVAQVIGIALVLLGIIFLLDTMDIFPVQYWWRHTWRFLAPSLLILAGIYFVVGRKSQTTAEPGTSSSALPPKRLHRSRIDKKILGVCGGLGEYFEIDPTLVRLLFVAFALSSAGFGLLLYLLLYLLMPQDQPSSASQQ